MEAHPAKIELPKLIHFIWAGGVSRPDEKDYTTIFMWAQNNPDFKINVWVDEKTDPEARKKYKKDLQIYYQQFLAEQRKVEKNTISHAEIDQLLNQILVNDISDNPTGINFRDEYVAYEIDKLTANYGSSSDLLRYAILYNCGGAYFDLDVLSGRNKLSEIEEYRNLPLNQHVLYLEHYTQRPEVEKSKLSTFDTDHIGNDTFVVTRHNPVMLGILNQAKQNYHITDNQVKRIEEAFAGKDIKAKTIERTGPSVVGRIIDKHTIPSRQVASKQPSEIHCTDSVIKRMRDGVHEFSKPSNTNTCNWLKAGVTNCEKFSDALERVFNTMKFELKHANVVRVDDHVFDVSTSCRIKPENIIIDVIPQILRMCKQISLNPQTLVEATGVYHGYSHFFDKNDAIFKLKEQDLNLALPFLLRPDYVENNRIASISNSKDDAIIVANFNKDIRKYVEYLNQRLSFIDALIINIKLFPKETRDVAFEKINSTLVSYNKFMNASQALLEYNGLFRDHRSMFQETYKKIDNKLNLLNLTVESISIAEKAKNFFHRLT